MKKYNILKKIFILMITLAVILVNIPVINVRAATEDVENVTINLDITDKSQNGYYFNLNAGGVPSNESTDGDGNVTSVTLSRSNNQVNISFTISAIGGVIDVTSLVINNTTYQTIMEEPESGLNSSSGWKIESSDDTNITLVTNVPVSDEGYLQVPTTTNISFTINQGVATDGSSAAATENVTVTKGAFRSGSATVKMTATKTGGYWTQAKYAIAEFQDTIEFVTNAFLSIAIIVSMIIFIINIIKYASTETHPVKRVASMKSFITSLVCISILGGVWFFSRLIIYLVI